GQVIGIGIGIPGTLNPQLRMLSSPPLMDGWDQIDIPNGLERELRILLKNKKFKVNVYLDNDANMGALGENRYGRGRGLQNMAYVKVGTGIGAGLILNGHLYRGSWGTAGELGHMTIDKDGPE